MLKRVLLITLTVFAFGPAFAQRDTAVYYLKYPEQIIANKDSADFYRVILPPDSATDPGLYIVKEFYKNGKLKLNGGSYTNFLNMVYQGIVISYFPNGHRKIVAQYESGHKEGDEIEYFPNGKVHTVKTYAPYEQPFFRECNDSTGNVMAKNGNGKWTTFFDDTFRKNYMEGMVKNDLAQGAWKGIIRDSINVTYVMRDGYMVSSTLPQVKSAVPAGKIITHVESVAEFPGGIRAFKEFINIYKHDPQQATDAGINGVVKFAFIVEANGSLSNIRVVKGLGYGCDEEAMRLVKKSPNWKPAIQDGSVVRQNWVLSIPFGQ